MCIEQCVRDECACEHLVLVVCIVFNLFRAALKVNRSKVKVTRSQKVQDDNEHNWRRYYPHSRPCAPP